MSVNSKMTAIADAIRGKTGGTEVLTLDAMAVAINGIEVGGGNTLEFEEKELAFAPLAEGEIPMNTDCGLTELKEGATYDVSWDGTVYTCTTQRVDEEGVYIIAMGNGAFITGEPDEVPFMFMYDAMGVMGMPGNVIVASLDENPTHTVGVKFNFTAGGGTGGDAENDTPFALITASAKRGGNSVDGAAVTATKGTTQITGTTDENGQCVLKVSESGTYTITSTYDGYTATNSVSVTVGSLSYTATAMTFFSATITVGTETGATVTVEKDGKVQTAVSEDMQAVFTVYEAGTYTVTSSYNGNTGNAQVDVTANGQNYTAVIYSSHLDLEETGWEQISAIGQSGEGQNFFAVGDTKSVELKGTVGTVVFDTTLLVYILGFNHNSTIEGNGIHFGGFKTTDGVDVALVDSNYGSTWSSEVDTEYKWYALLNSYGTFQRELIYDTESQYVKTTFGAGYTKSYITCLDAIDHLGEKSLLSAIPVELKNALKYAKKHDIAGNVTTETSAHVHLLAPYEIFGTDDGVNPTSYWAQYEYYINGNSKVKYKHDSTSQKCNWLTRRTDKNSKYYYVNTSGTSSNTTTQYSYGIAPVFVL